MFGNLAAFGRFCNYSVDAFITFLEVQRSLQGDMLCDIAIPISFLPERSQDNCLEKAEELKAEATEV